MSRLEENNLTKKLKHNGFRLYLFAFLIAPSGYLLKLMIARELSVEDIGLFYSILGLISIISSYNDLGLTEALQYFLPKYLLRKEIDKARSLIWFTRGMQFITGILISGALYLSAPWLAGHYFESQQAVLILRIFCLYFLVINLYQVLYSLFFATQQIKLGQTIEFVKMRSTVIFTTISIFFLDNFSILQYSKIWVMGVLIGIFLGIILFRKKFYRITQGTIKNIYNTMSIKKWIYYGRRVMLGSSGSLLFMQISQQLILIFLGTRDAGIWAYFITFISVIQVITQPLSNYLFPLLNELHEKKEHKKVVLLYKYLLLGIVLFGFISGIIGYFFGPDVAELLFGIQFRQSGELFRIFAPRIRTIPFISFMLSDIASRGLIKARVLILFLSATILFLSTLYSIINQFGLLGSINTYILGNLCLILLCLLVYKKRTD